MHTTTVWTVSSLFVASSMAWEQGFPGNQGWVDPVLLTPLQPTNQFQQQQQHQQQQWMPTPPQQWSSPQWPTAPGWKQGATPQQQLVQWYNRPSHVQWPTPCPTTAAVQQKKQDWVDPVSLTPMKQNQPTMTPCPSSGKRYHEPGKGWIDPVPAKPQQQQVESIKPQQQQQTKSTKPTQDWVNPVSLTPLKVQTNGKPTSQPAKNVQFAAAEAKETKESAGSSATGWLSVIGACAAAVVVIGALVVVRKRRQQANEANALASPANSDFDTVATPPGRPYESW